MECFSGASNQDLSSYLFGQAAPTLLCSHVPLAFEGPPIQPSEVDFTDAVF
jgi:hypothetical protein